MSLIDHTLTQTGNIIPTTRDSHGDQIAGTPEGITCRFRYVTGVERLQNREALAGIDAIIWLRAEEEVEEGTILQVDGHYWRVDRLVKARKLSGSTVEFLKAYVQKHSI